MKVEEKFRQKLLVEGNDDQHVVWSLCNRFSVPKTFDVIDCDGITNLLPLIPVRLKQADIDAIGIVVDADTNVASRWLELKGKLEYAGCTLPETPSEEGFIGQTSDGVRVGVWVMPDNSLPGMLENFVSLLVPEGDRLKPELEIALTDYEERKLVGYTPIHRPKALIHSWLALQEDPGTPMGLAITKRYLTTDGDLPQKFVAWLNRLFNPTHQQ